MLPKCMLRASRQGGHHCKYSSIEQLCSLWSPGDIGIIWKRINKRPVIPPQKLSGGYFQKEDFFGYRYK